MADREVSVGRATSGDALPVMTLGVGRDVVALVDASVGSLDLLPTTGTTRTRAQGAIVASADYVVVAATTCASRMEPDVEVGGFSCVPYEETRTEVRILDRTTRRWRRVSIPELPAGGVEVVEINDSRVLLEPLIVADGETPPRFGVSLRDGTVERVPSPEPKPTCAFSQAPALTFDRLEGPTTATVDGSGSVRLDPQLTAGLRPLAGTAMACWSARSFLVLPGHRQALAVASTALPADEPTTTAAAASAATTEPTGGSRDPRLAVHDLRAPGAAPVRVGDTATTASFMAGDRFWAILGDRRLFVGTGRGVQSYEQPLAEPATVLAADRGLVAFGWADGNLDALRVLPLTEAR